MPFSVEHGSPGLLLTPNFQASVVRAKQKMSRDDRLTANGNLLPIVFKCEMSDMVL